MNEVVHGIWHWVTFHERIQSKLLSEFWGKPTFLGAHVLPHFR